MMHAITRDDFMMQLEMAADRLAGDGEPELADVVSVALRVLEGGV